MQKPAKLLQLCAAELPSVVFAESTSFYWSPRTRTVYYDPAQLNTMHGQMALLHEAGHAILDHKHYSLDIELLGFEVSAWKAAIEQAIEWSIPVDAEHVEDCLDTYRDWLYARSTCPTCKANAPQITRAEYKCINCSTTWSVSPSRFCRPYRMQSRHQKTPSGQNQTVFR